MASIEQARNKAGLLHKRSKQLLALAIVTAAMSHQHAHGQTFAEWFSQKKTQKKYLLQQIAALNAYRTSARKGYSIAKGGLGSIGSFLGSEYGLHNGFYNHLKTVNSAIKNDPQVKEILSWQQDILLQTSAARRQEGLTAEEIVYTNKVCDAVLKDCDGQLSDLQTVLADNKTAMSDEERLRQLNRIHAAMQDNYRFSAVFADQLKLYSLQKKQEKKDVNTLKGLL